MKPMLVVQEVNQKRFFQKGIDLRQGLLILEEGVSGREYALLVREVVLLGSFLMEGLRKLNQ